MALKSDPDFAVNLIDCTSFEQCMERVQAFAEDHPNNKWIVGYQDSSGFPVGRT